MPKPTTTEPHVGSSKLKALAEELIALSMRTSEILFEIGRMAAGAMAHDIADDALHPVVIKAFRDLGEIIIHLTDVAEGITPLDDQLALAESIRQTGYNAAIEAANIDYARRDGEEIQKAVVPMIESALRHTDALRAVRQKIEEATSRTPRK